MPDETPDAEGVETPADTEVAETPDAPAEWDGDFTQLDAQPWWTSVPESARGHLTKMHEDFTSTKGRAEHLEQLFQADDAVAAVMAELETSKSEMASLKEALSGKDTALTKAEERARALEARFEDQEAEQEYAALEAKYPDIFADLYFTDEAQETLDMTKGAYARFLKLRSAGFDDDTAAEMARTALPKADPAAAPETPVAPKERDVKPPPSIAAATPGGNTPSATVSMAEANEGLEERLARMKKEAEREAG